MSEIEKIAPPEEFLQSNIGKEVIVKLQTNEQYKGRLISLDGAMNIYLQNVEEIFENNSNEKKKQFKHLFIRGNNGNYIYLSYFLVLYISKDIKNK